MHADLHPLSPQRFRDNLAAKPKSKWAKPLTLAAMSLGYGVVQLDVTIVNTALNSIGSALGGGVSELQWVVSTYTIAFAALILTAGALGDRLGAKNIFMAGFSVFTAASLACALAPSAATLIAARAMQGVGAAILVPNSLALLNHAYPDAKERGRAVAMWAAGASLALTAGPFVGGALISLVGLAQHLSGQSADRARRAVADLALCDRHGAHRARARSAGPGDRDCRARCAGGRDHRGRASRLEQWLGDGGFRGLRRLRGPVRRSGAPRARSYVAAVVVRASHVCADVLARSLGQYRGLRIAVRVQSVLPADQRSVAARDRLRLRADDGRCVSSQSAGAASCRADRRASCHRPRCVDLGCRLCCAARHRAGHELLGDLGRSLSPLAAGLDFWCRR